MSKIIENFLKKNNFCLKNITESTAKNIVIFAINQYFDKKISVSFISTLVDNILYTSFRNKNKSIEDVELLNTLEILSELEYNKKNNPNEFKKDLKELKGYINLS